MSGCLHELEFNQRLTRTEDRCKANSRRLEEVERRQDDLDRLVTSVEVLATREEAVESDVKEIKADVKSLAARPGKRWEELINKLILVTATAIVTWLLSQVGIC